MSFFYFDNPNIPSTINRLTRQLLTSRHGKNRFPKTWYMRHILLELRHYACLGYVCSHLYPALHRCYWMLWDWKEMGDFGVMRSDLVKKRMSNLLEVLPVCDCFDGVEFLDYRGNPHFPMLEGPRDTIKQRKIENPNELLRMTPFRWLK